MANQGSSKAGFLDEFKLRDELKSLRAQIPDQPSLNPIVNVAFWLSRQLEARTIKFDDLKQLAGRLMDRAFVRRAHKLREQIGFTDTQATLKEFSEYISKTASGNPDQTKAFELFKQRWSRARNGIVFTAHPTFGLSNDLSRRLVSIATGEDKTPNPEIGLPHRPDPNITLEYEHEAVQFAIQNLRNAQEDLLNTFFSVAASKFGESAYKFLPKLVTVASWVGYDLDGRTDIKWTHSFLLKLLEKRMALLDIRTRFLALKHRAGDGPDLQRIARQITGKLDLAIAAVEKQYEILKESVSGNKPLAEAANIISNPDPYNLVSTEPVVHLLHQLIDVVPQQQSKRDIAALASLFDQTGLGTSHIHVRVNAVQLNNAFRAFVHEPWTRDLSERQALVRIVEMIHTAGTESVNFESLDQETATAIRQFVLIAQIHKHIDRDTPIRYLIAECESPATILIALFFAKLFGVLKLVDISPLFETPAALETGARMIERLLEEKAYREYVEGRQRLCIQTGFSDAGRFIGQIAATLSIERLHQGLAETLEAAHLKGIELLIFSTHGESMGRGTHPGSMSKRLRYVFSHNARLRFAKANIPLKHETSWQGGDGYLYFANRALSTRALSSVVMDGEVPDYKEDLFYDDTNLALDFLLRLRAYQQDLFAHPGYRAVLGAFGSNLLFKTGSRPVKRQMEGLSSVDRGDPARMRAIPNNAILQQFGYIANVVAGMGAALGSEHDRFVELAKTSPRLRTLMEMVARGKTLSSLNAMGANAIVFDPGFWAMRASWGKEPHLTGAFKTLSSSLLEDPRAGAINGLVHELRLDAIDLHALLEDIGIDAGKIPDENRLELDLLQAIRLSLIMRVFILAAQLPRFATRNDVSHAQIFSSALSLEIPEVISVMRLAFPKRHNIAKSSESFDEKATYLPQGMDDYGRIETEILEPMEQAFEFIREIGTGISHHFCAFG
ncbi:MAG: phosphoenolpyruvate carboxylase [Hyphomicrobium sp.]